MANSLIPNPNYPLVNSAGVLSTAWYTYFSSLQNTSSNNTSSAGIGGGNVTSVSVTSTSAALTASVANPTTTPSILLSPNILTSTSAGIVPASGGGLLNYLRADATWDNPFPMVNVQTFGATGNGSTDDTAAIQAAINSVPNGQAVIFFPSGTYLISNALTVSVGQGGLKLTGSYGTVLYQSTHNHDFIDAAPGNFEISGMQYQAGAFGSGAPYVINYSGTSLFVNEVIMVNVASGINMTGNGATINQVLMQGIKPASGIGITITNPAATVFINNCELGNGTAPQNAFAGIYITGCGSVQITGCQLFKMGTALYVNPAANTTCGAVWSTNTFYDTSVTGCIASATATGSEISTLSFTQCWLNGHSSSGLLINGSVLYTSVIGGTVLGNTGIGIYLESTGVVATIIEGVQIQGNTNNGIQVAAGVSDFSIIGNRISSNGSYGIYIPTGASNEFIITNNRLYNNTTGSISNGATGGSTLVTNNLT